jgi:hypothetical protein
VFVWVIGRRRELVVDVLDEEERRLRIVKLVAQLRRRQPPGERQQHRAELRAAEQDHRVRRRVAGERRHAVTAPHTRLRECRRERI